MAKVFRSTLDYLYNLTKFNPRYSTEPTKKLLALLNHPEKSFQTIVVAGTNGKGSVCAMLENTLRQAGFKTGLFTSPHLEKFNERIKVGTDCLKQISDEDIVRLTLKLKPLIKKLRSSGCDVSFHEALVPLAFLYFQEKKVDLAVLEVGMGGRLDAVNVTHPLLSIITNIQYDHMEVLGDTLTKIAREKMGILPPKGKLITATRGEGLKEIKRIMRPNLDNLTIIKNKDIRPLSRPDLGKKILTQSFDYKKLKNIELSLIGPHQFRNSAIVIETIEKLKEKEFKISENNLRDGLRNAFWPGRFEIKNYKKHTLVFDCAHNPAGIKALAKTLESIFKKGKKEKFICIFGVSYSLITKKPNPKKIKQMLQPLLPWVDKIIFSQAEYRGVEITLLDKIYQTLHTSAISYNCPSPKKALQTALKIAHKNQLILICGSIYLIGEIRKSI